MWEPQDYILIPMAQLQSQIVLLHLIGPVVLLQQLELGKLFSTLLRIPSIINASELLKFSLDQTTGQRVAMQEGGLLWA
jgi:hypothetical protein